MSHFTFNGKLLPEGTAIAGPDNRTIRYGDGVFETIRLLNGKLQLMDEHFARLWKGMKTLGFEIPPHFTPEKIIAEITALATKNGHGKSARVRLQILRGNGGLFDIQTHLPQYIIQTWALDPDNGFNTNGLVIGLYEEVLKSCDVLANIKHCNYLPAVMAALHAKKQKWNDAIILNQHGRICETTIANIFLIKDKMVSTPALTEGCVAGTIRKQVLDVLNTSGWNVQETSVSKKDLLEADEIFVTNSIHPLRWVQSIGNQTYSNHYAMQIYSALMATIR